MRLRLALLALPLAVCSRSAGLRAGDHVEGSLKGGETRVYEMQAAPGEVLAARVAEHGIHVSLALQTADGVESLTGTDSLEAVSEAPGRYRLVVSPRSDDAANGRFTLERLPARTASAADRSRFGAARRMWEGHALLRRETEATSLEAEKKFQEARQLSQAASDLAGEFDAVGMLSEARDNLGDMKGSQAYNEECLALARKAGDSLRESDALQWMGIAETHFGQIDLALEHLRAALAKASAGGDRKREGDIKVSLAFSLGQRQAGDEGALLLEQALPLLKEYGNYYGEATAHNNLGVYERRLGEGEQALAHLRESLRVSRQHKARGKEALALLNLGNTLTETLDRPAEALPLLSQALALREELGDRLEQGWALTAMGAARQRLGRSTEALADFARALDLWKGSENPSGEAEAQLGIGQAKVALGDRAGARQAFAAAQDLAHRAEARRTEARARLELARLALAAGDTSTARRESAAAIDVIETTRTAYGRADLRAAFFAVVQPAYDLNLELVMRGGDEAEGFRASESARARTLLEAISAGGGAPAAAPPPPARIRSVQALLDPGTVLVEYALGEERSFAWVVSRAGFRTAVLASRRDLEESARRYLERLTARNEASPTGAPRGARIAAADQELPAAARGLSDRVLSPLRLPPAARLVVVPDGILHYVPFAALPWPATQAPTIGDREVVILPSASVLGTLRGLPRRAAAAGRIVVLADPVFGPDDPRLNRPGRAAAAPAAPPAGSIALRSAEAVGLAGLPRLWFSRAEGEAIAALAPGQVDLRLDFDASRDAFAASEVTGGRILHLATHGLVNSRNPQLTGLVFSMLDAGGAPHDGFLRLADVQALRLRSDLVVLSACQTALGKEVRGEGLVGLTRGFMMAGAPRVVASLWRVDDHATAALMKSFYAAMLQRGLPAAAALAEAQRTLRADPRWASPYYWAGFTFNGDWK